MLDGGKACLTNCEKEDAKERRSLDRGALGGCVLVAPGERRGHYHRQQAGWPAPGGAPAPQNRHGGVVVASGPGTYAAKLWSE